MACKEDTKEINGKTYYVVQLPAKQALKLKFKLAALLGSGLSELAKGIGADETKQKEAMFAGLIKLFESADPDQLVDLLVETTERAKCDGGRIEFDSHFQNDLATVYKVFIWILQVNFGDFLKGGLAQELLSKTAK